MQWTDPAGNKYTLRTACYEGNLPAVRALLDLGVDPNLDADDDSGRRWISAGGKTPTPLHCVAIAWSYEPAHADIARLLIERGATVLPTVIQDWWVETTLTENAMAVGEVLGIPRDQMLDPRAEHGEADK